MAYYIYGPAGGAKTEFFDVVQALISSEALGAIGEKVLDKAGAAKSTLVKGKSLIVCSDVNPEWTSNFTENIRQITGNDITPTDQKYKDAISFKSTSFMMISGNTSPNEIKAFSEKGIRNRFAPLSIPAVSSDV